MGCGNTKDAGAVDYITPIVCNPVESNPVESNPVESNPVESNPVESTPPNKTITFNFQLSSGEEYSISGKENDQFKNVFVKFKSEHSEINNKKINALFKINPIDVNKTLLENNITDNNILLLDLEEPEEEEEVDENDLEYSQENVIWFDEHIDNSDNKGYLSELNSLGYNVRCCKNIEEGFTYIKWKSIY